MQISKRLAEHCLPELMNLWASLNDPDQQDCLYAPIMDALEKLNAKALTLPKKASEAPMPKKIHEPLTCEEKARAKELFRQSHKLSKDELIELKALDRRITHNLEAYKALPE